MHRHVKDNASSRDKSGEPSSSERRQVDELRELLFGSEKQRLEELRQRLDDPKQRAKDVSRILAEALRMRWHQDDQIARAIQPAIEETLHRSVRKNPKALADAIFPVMGPALRKAISAALMGMIQSLNQLINHSVSLRGVKWRIEAFKTRKSFAEVVLLHTLLFRVEQIFLIHKETGLVLHHVSADGNGIKDPDLISGMLTAIQDFVQDSFGSRQEELIDTLRIGNQRSVWLEQGTNAILAAVIQGTPPLDLRADIHDTLDMVHLRYADALENFKGDTGPFDDLSDELKGLLQVRVKEKTSRPSPTLLLLLLITIAAIITGSALLIRQQRTWAHYLSLLRAEPGIVVLDAGKQDGKYHVTGLRDPLSRDPAAVLAETDIAPQDVLGSWQPFQSMDNPLILARAKVILKPPDGVTLKFSDGTLFAGGFAGHQWITAARSAAPAISGVIHFDENGLVDIDLNQFHQAKERLEHKIIYFRKGTTALDAGQQDNINDLAGIVNELQMLGRDKHIFSQIIIYGHTDASGTDEINLSLSRSRAGKMLSLLIAAGVDPVGVTPVGMGSGLSLQGGKSRKDHQVNRSVTFKVIRRKAEFND